MTSTTTLNLRVEAPTAVEALRRLMERLTIPVEEPQDWEAFDSDQKQAQLKRIAQQTQIAEATQRLTEPLALHVAERLRDSKAIVQLYFKSDRGSLYLASGSGFDVRIAHVLRWEGIGERGAAETYPFQLNPAIASELACLSGTDENTRDRMPLTISNYCITFGGHLVWAAQPAIEADAAPASDPSNTAVSLHATVNLDAALPS